MSYNIKASGDIDQVINRYPGIYNGTVKMAAEIFGRIAGNEMFTVYVVLEEKLSADSNEHTLIPQFQYAPGLPNVYSIFFKEVKK